jgi:hypothetical protein
VSLSFSAVAPPVNLVFSVVNQPHFNSTPTNLPGPGVLAAISSPRSATVASNGTIYFSDSNQQIYKVQPSGVMSVLVPNTVGFAPWGVTLDEAKGIVYFGDTNGYVRSVNVASGGLSVVAGAPSGGNADGPATSTTLGSPSRVRLIGGKIYVSDRISGGNGSRLRLIDPGQSPPTIVTYLFPYGSAALTAPTTQTSCTAPTTPPLVFYYCGTEPGCSVAAAPDGRLYVSGWFCGSQIASGNSPAIVRVELNGTLTLVTTQSALSALATDAAGNLYIAKGSTPNFGYYAADANGIVGPLSSFVALAQGPTIGAEYVDQSLTAFNLPNDVVFGAGHIWIPDYGLSALRVLW